ncbi:DotG/IcmE/VirB10 family protein [Aurantimonas sp. C2-6-R+9]|uniref:DotG/IcmE/VirB10 family protein n=1 Tax=unclassified Aurantimonas TaxID=2638230 RepID=UPI002E19BCC9|nr:MULTISPECIES: DotG/IcmE/VirB10 family protein [unclassified Aurantimonas]MEC5291944.1 DotG/IcmE/VirB10 family protein [Aurantimonas sp. C2-3-R2]MEC5383241.1 DotG/IcmE/VirB10 family protein [Aurantimonas sp. C2-6-R+9]MEC5413030.1 DotG/IcmE/VirB10 family protein [Aurantimonas sp. C2-4-R8]
MTNEHNANDANDANNVADDAVIIESPSEQPASDASASTHRSSPIGVTRTRHKSRAPAILGGALVISAVAGVAYSMSGGDPILASRMTRGPTTIDGTPAGEQLASSDFYRQTLNVANNAGAELAAATDTQSFMSTPDEPVQQRDPVDDSQPIVVTAPKLPPANERPQREAQVRTETKTVYVDRPVATAATPTDWSALEGLTQAMANQQEKLEQSWAPGQTRKEVVVTQELYAAPDGQAVGVEVGAGRPNPTVGQTYQADLSTSLPYFTGRQESEPSLPVAVGRRLNSGHQPQSGDFYAAAGDVTFAVLINGSDTDTPGPVVAKIAKGPLKGARLIGGFAPNSENTAMIVQFDRVILADGTNLETSAYAIDASDATLAVRSDYDARLLQRYGPKLAGAFLNGLGEAIGRAGQTLVPLGLGAGIVQDEPSTEEAIYSGLGEVGGQLADEIEDIGPAGPIVRLNAGSLVGILFTENVSRL